ncbi:MAG: PilZ domain-containing protein [Nannocystaceae bacterium]|nr:PilZ domain-containing protein [bacterium]
MSSESERRRAPRFNVTFRLVCDDGEEFANAVVINLSDSGALVQTDRSYALGDVLSLVPVGTAGEILFDVHAEVVRVVGEPDADGSQRYGLRFEGLTPRCIRAMRRLCEAMPETPEELPGSEAPIGGPARHGSESHYRIRTRVGGTPTTPRWAKRPFAR